MLHDNDNNNNIVCVLGGGMSELVVVTLKSISIALFRFVLGI